LLTKLLKLSSIDYGQGEPFSRLGRIAQLVRALR